jgi:glutamine phosphoribosylpyrophosphate amidotransferase
MCGVLGIAIKNFTEKDHDLVRNLFIQSMIRGKHATGVSYVKNNKIVTVKEPVPANEFIIKQNLEDWKNEDGNLYCIGHIRYSTSDLRFNQPMANDKIGIVHNGVISQEPRETWEHRYGFVTETSNDSELVLRALEKGENPLTFFHPASMAVCGVDNEKKIIAFRNHERPLYCHKKEDMVLFASTADILRRCNLVSEKLPMYEVFTVDNFQIKSYNTVVDNVEDLQ